MIHAVESEKKLEILHRQLRLDLSVNDVRILVGCLRGMSYMMKMDDEPYLDADALELQRRLERRYEEILTRAENRRAS
jgi:hypothetical protein